MTIIRLRSGDLVMHSTAPFSPVDVRAIQALGRPAWLAEATLFHDTFAVAGHAAFTEVPYAVPEGFPVRSGRTISLDKPPTAWADELQVLLLEGMPRVREHVFFHGPSRTLIVADLVFNFGPQSPALTRWVFRWVSGIRTYPGVSRLFRLLIADRAAFRDSIQRMMLWDFDRLIVGHGEIIESDAKPKLAAALQTHHF